jgi:hypothetical protein
VPGSGAMTSVEQRRSTIVAVDGPAGRPARPPLIPAVLGGDSVPLDLGRSRRLHIRSQPRALALTHDTGFDLHQQPNGEWTYHRRT